MYKCEICRKIVPPHTPAHRIPVELRIRRYPKRRDANLVFGKRKNPHKDKDKAKENGFRNGYASREDDAKNKSGKANHDGRRQKKGAWIDDAGGTGYEIVREITACADCAGPHLAAVPIRRGGDRGPSLRR